MAENSKYDLEAQMARDEENIVIAQNNKDLAYVNLKVLMNVDVAKEIAIQIVGDLKVDETLEDGSERTVLRLPAVLAPYKAAILPLVKKDGLPEIAREIFEDLKWEFNVDYDEKDAVGRRYRRQDANGTPFCITVDHETLQDNSVTIRHRDSMEQKRVPIADVKAIIKAEVDMKTWLQRM